MWLCSDATHDSPRERCAQKNHPFDAARMRKAPSRAPLAPAASFPYQGYSQQRLGSPAPFPARELPAPLPLGVHGQFVGSPHTFFEMPPLVPELQIPALSPEEDDALLAELCKKVKTDDPNDATVIDPDEVCCDPAQRMYAIMTEPNIFLVRNFLSDIECDHLLELARANWAPTLVMTAGANGNFDDLQQKSSTLRTSHGSIIDYAATPMVADIERRLSSLAGMDVNHLERLVMVRYDEGQQYKIHHDGTWRLVTVFIYLNDLPEDAEGETFFPNLDIKIKPRKGCAVMWPNTCGVGPDGAHVEDLRMMHAGLPPKSCRKFGVNCFFNVAPKRLEGDDAHHGQGPPTAAAPRRISIPRRAEAQGASQMWTDTPSTNVTPRCCDGIFDSSHLAMRSRRPPPTVLVRPTPHMATIPQSIAVASLARANPIPGYRCGAPAIENLPPFQVLA